MKLSDQIEPTSEETAKEFGNLLCKMVLDAEKELKLLDKYNQMIKTSAINAISRRIAFEINKNIKYFIKTENATFITRWYWKRKLDKSDKRLYKLHEQLKEIEKININ